MNTNRKTTETKAAFMTIRQTAKHTGLPEHFIRQRVKSGIVPFVPVGNRKMINVTHMLDTLHQESLENCISE